MSKLSLVDNYLSVADYFLSHIAVYYLLQINISHKGKILPAADNIYLLQIIIHPPCSIFILVGSGVDLGSISLRGSRFYKGHEYIAEMY
jgi:hypothetical protein